ncbi:DUF917 domain-containing protein [Pseudonocardia sp. HH130630-07]|uniref:DUF917 domain-containing protein n=1 Tax=Pseudonocardia sp. HH130630-07 TaxID=1690815 RepID=UPI00081522D4|nr:DUF917 domain-containing protein [Pseudonocardia sp. HH130630-07]ANY09304.1 hypothetical protein AFB00_27095 [Pseudonocardia sp. HH130630-07]
MGTTAAADPRRITRADVAPLAAGAAVFGTGGGGAVHTVQLAVESAVAEHGPVRLLDVDELGPDDLVITMSAIGAPSVGIEMLGASAQAPTLLAEVQRLLDRPVTAIMAAEIGGSNGVAPVGWAASSGLAVLDADGMGRAFPKGTMISMNVAGLPSGFAVNADVVGNVAVFRTVDMAWLERHARAFTVAAGGIALGAHYPLTAETAKGAVIEGTVGRAIAVGRRLLGSADPVADVAAELGAAVLASGKVIDIERITEGGFTRGSVTVEGVGPDRGRLLRIEIQNENLVVIEDGAVTVSVPDLVTVVDSETGHAISTELLRFGQRVSVLAWACDPLWRTARGIELTGPRAFGYDLDYVPFDGARAAGALR